MENAPPQPQKKSHRDTKNERKRQPIKEIQTLS